MSDGSSAMPRRTLLKSAGLGIGAYVLSSLQTAASAAANEEIWSAEYWANKGPVKLNLWRKRVGAPKAGQPQMPVLFLVHGSSNSARSSYATAPRLDLQSDPSYHPPRFDHRR